VHVNDVTVTAAQKIIKNSNHSYVRNVFTHYISKISVNLKIRLRLPPDLSFQIRQNPAPAGLENNKSGTALHGMNLFCILPCHHMWSDNFHSSWFFIS